MSSCRFVALSACLAIAKQFWFFPLQLAQLTQQQTLRAIHGFFIHFLYTWKMILKKVLFDIAEAFTPEPRDGLWYHITSANRNTRLTNILA